jgi:L-Lysine epsilon oxidase N-terminal/L-lysine epsilon oxidase C-terminal domain
MSTVNTLNTASIVEARIHPAIGIARVGNSPDEYFIGPEVPFPTGPPPGGYRDAQGRLKRQAARFRIYGYDADGNVVGEITSAQADIAWTVNIANKKSAWYQFDMVLDLKPESSAVQSPRRNAQVHGADRIHLEITPDPQTIAGNNQTSPPFDTGQFCGHPIYLGELRTDDAGRLLFLGGRGAAGSPFAGYSLVTFGNNPGWHDDTSDGPVDATVTIGGRAIPCAPAWVVTAPPSFAPDIIGVVTMYDVIYDALAGAIIPNPSKPSFTRDILPIFQRLANLQWVNTGFFVQFGHLAPNDLLRPDLLARLASPGPEYHELRNQIRYMFRDPGAALFQPWQWPPIYGDAMKIVPLSEVSPRGALSVTPTQYTYLTQWMNGNFDADYDPSHAPLLSIEAYVTAEQPDTLDRAALTFCLGGPFHPGCEMTWPMRQTCMFTGKFRLRRHPEGFKSPDYGDFLNQMTVLGTSGPLSASGPGDITKWMSVPWHADAASCQQGYSYFESQQGPFNVDPYLPTFWAARVPNEVLSERHYQIVMDPKQPLDNRIAAFQRRSDWTRNLFKAATPYIEQLANMVHSFDTMGVVERRPGIAGDPNFPGEMFVETLAGPAPQPLGSSPELPDPPATSPATASRYLLHARFGGRRER